MNHYYTLPLAAVLPARLERLAGRASSSLRVEEGRSFTAAHRRLWAEFTGRVALPAPTCASCSPEPKTCSAGSPVCPS